MDDRMPYRKPKTMRQLEAEGELLREMVAELLPYAADSCPEECRYRDECESEANRGSGGWPLVCVAYGHLLKAARELGVEVSGA